MSQPLPSEIALPGDAPVSHAARRGAVHEVARLTAENAALRAERDAARNGERAFRTRLCESRAQTAKAIEIHSTDVEKRERAHRAEVDVLEAILASLSPDWDTDHLCGFCEERYREPEHELCGKCESDVESAEEERAERLWEDRA